MRPDTYPTKENDYATLAIYRLSTGMLARATRLHGLGAHGHRITVGQPFTTFTEGLLGSPAPAGVALAILLTGLMWAHTHHQPGIVKGTATVAGGAVAIKALDLMNLFGWGGALF